MDALLQQVAALAAKQPEKTAVADGSDEITYAELERASERLAGLITDALAADGLTGPNRFVTCLCRIGIDSIIYHLAAAKAGTVVFFLNPDHPVASLRDSITFTDTARLVVPPEHTGMASGLHEKPAIVMDRSALTAPGAPRFVQPAHAADSWAMANLTSGSTGRPKVVVFGRRQCDLKWQRRQHLFAPDTQDRVVAIAPTALTDCQYALASGATLDCFDFARHGAVAMADWMRERCVTFLPCFVALYRQLVSATAESFPDVRQVVVVGEAIRRADLEAFNRQFPPGSQFCSRFGASECETIAVFRHRQGDAIPFDTAPLGDLTDPAALQLLTEDGRAAALEERGELVVMTELAATCYLNDPERTAERFRQLPDGRMRVATGDMAYRGRDGMLHSAGRKDFQLKIRGYSVRLSDVEQALLDHPAVRQAAVVPFERSGHLRQLAAYVTLRAPGSAEPGHLRAFLRERHPNYLVPSEIILMDTLPTAANGKVLLRELPDPLAARHRTAGLENARAGRLFGDGPEARIAAIWQELLGHADFGPDDDFFDLGGDSLQAMSMIVAIEQAFGRRLPLESLILDGASVHTLADKVHAPAARHHPTGRVVTVKRGGEDPPLFLLHSIGGHLSDYLLIAHAIDAHRAAYGVHPKGMEDAEAPGHTMEDLAQDAAEAIMRHGQQGPCVLMGFSYAGMLALETARALAASGKTPPPVIAIDPGVPWTDPLRRVRNVARPLLRGQDAGLAAGRLRAAFGASAGSDLAEIHREAGLRYRPAPLALPAALLLSAKNAPDCERKRQEWTRLLGPNVRRNAYACGHVDLVAEPFATRLARDIDEWLSTLPQSASGEV